MWIDEKKNLDTSGGRIRHVDAGRRRPVFRQAEDKKFGRVYTVAEIADILNVTKPTIMCWLEYDEGSPETAVIHPSHWFRLPNGHIRIREPAVLKLAGG